MENAKEQFILTKNNKEVTRGTEIECLQKMHNMTCYSWDYAFKYGGFKLEEVSTS